MASRQTGSPRAIVSVAQPGLTAISYASLAAIGFPLAGIDPLFFHLTRAGSEIAMQWDGDGDSVFEAGERLLFVADPRFSRWTNTDEYYLVCWRSTWLAHDEPAGPSRAATCRNRLAHADIRNQHAVYPDLLLRARAAGARRRSLDLGRCAPAGSCTPLL